MFVVICHPDEGDIDVFAPFPTEKAAKTFINSINKPGENNNCLNDHYVIEAIDPTIWEKP